MSVATESFAKIHALLKKGKFTIALAMLRDAETRRIKPEFRFDTNHAWYCVGDILYKKHQFERAKDAFRRSLRSRPDDVEALWAIGNCYDGLRKPKLAERYFLRALACSNEVDTRYTIMFNLANALFDQRRMADAAKVYEKLSKAPSAVQQKARKNLAAALAQINSQKRSTAISKRST